MLELLKLLFGFGLVAAIIFGPIYVWVTLSDSYHRNASYRRRVSGKGPCPACGGSGQGVAIFNPNRAEPIPRRCPRCKGFG
jgi:hypothetical protein